MTKDIGQNKKGGKYHGKRKTGRYLPERPKQAKKRTMQKTISFTDKNKYQIKSQIFSG